MLRPYRLQLEPPKILVQVRVIFRVYGVLDGGPMLPVIRVESFQRRLKEGLPVLAQVNWLSVQVSMMRLDPMHLFEIPGDELVRLMHVSHDLLLLWSRHPHRLLGPEATARILLLEVLAVHGPTDDELTRLYNVLRQPLDFRLEVSSLATDLA